jgi:amidase
MGPLPALLLAMPNANTENILSMDACSLSKELEARRLTAEQLMEATLHRIEELNPRCNAIISLRDREELLDEARQADRIPRKGWLHGIPVAVKDLSHVAGIPSTMGGSPLYQNFTPAINDPFVTNILGQGAIVIGKTNTPESGLGSHTFNSKWGTTTNPFNSSKSSGGSSGGAAVAVSTRMLCIADGTDMMGSLRNPAGWNNLFSHRPTAGMIPGAIPDNVNPLDYPISTAGPMARSPMDVAHLLEAMAGNDKFDSSTVSSNGSVKGMRIGWLGDWGREYSFEEEIIPLCRKALDVLNQNENVVVDDLSDTPLFEANKLWKSWNNVRGAVVSSSFIQLFGENRLLGDDSQIKDNLKWEISKGKEVTKEDLKQAGEVAKEWASCLETVFDKYDALALPSAQVWPFPSEWEWPKHIGEKDMDTYHRWMEVAVPVSFGGLPCSTIPAGFGDNGLPMGVQLFGKRGDDTKLLRIAQAYHKHTKWPHKIEFSKSPDSILTFDANRTSGSNSAIN